MISASVMPSANPSRITAISMRVSRTHGLPPHVVRPTAEGTRAGVAGRAPSNGGEPSHLRPPT